MNDRPVSRPVPYHEEKPNLFGRDRHKIRILGDIIEPIGVTWEVEKGGNVGDRCATLGIY